MFATHAIARRLRALRDADARRPGLPGEHWAAFGAGLAAVRSAGRSRSPAWRGALWLVGGLLLARALSGRDGPVARWRGGAPRR